MRPDVVVVLSPGGDGRLRIVDVREPVEIEAVLAELAVEALDERFLNWLARLNEGQLDARLLRLEEHRIAGQLGAVVADDGAWQRLALGEPVELARKPQLRDREIDNLGDALAAAVVDDIEHPESPPVGQLIRHEADRIVRFIPAAVRKKVTMKSRNRIRLPRKSYCSEYAAKPENTAIL